MTFRPIAEHLLIKKQLPFTPFHMGAALLAKPALGRRFSVMTFGIAQIAMDIEPGVRMMTRSDVLHGPTHTILGALVIAFLVMLVAPSICNCLLTKWNHEVIHYKMPSLVHSVSVSKTAVVIGAFFGTLSHVMLDSMLHHDIQPLSPFLLTNPLMGLLTHDGVYLICTIGGAVGIAAWIAMKWGGRSSKIVGASVAHEPLVIGVSKGALALWVKELRFTWFWIVLLTVAPAALYGASIFSFMVLMAAVLIGIPSVAIGCFVANGSKMKGLRRLAVMAAVSLLTLVYVSQVDKQIPENAIPITKAIETFRSETGRYPDSLEMIIPKYLPKMPDVRFSVVQPLISYSVTNGKPYLAIPSALGDMFAKFKYDFETKVWIHEF